MSKPDHHVASDPRMRVLAEASLLIGGEPFAVFEQIARLLSAQLDLPLVCLSAVDGAQLRVLALARHGLLQDDAPSTMPLAPTPCASVWRDRTERVYHDVRARFPDVHLLDYVDAYSYCGFPAIGSTGEVLAVTCMIDHRPRHFSADDIAVFRLLGQRIAAELERQRQREEARDARNRVGSRERMLATLAESANAMPWEFDAVQNRFTYIGAQIESMLGVTPAAWCESSGWHDTDFPDDREWTRAHYRRLKAGEPHVTFEHRRRARDGRVVWLRSTINRETDESGRPVFVGFSLDVTQARRVSEAMSRLSALDSRAGLEPFLRQCIATLAEIYAVPCASVVRLDDAAGTGGAPMLTSHAVLQDGEFIGNLSYGVAGTPCERVLRDGLLCIGEGVADAFPEDTFLREMGIVGYYGVRLDSAAGETLGVVSMMSRAPLDPEPSIKPLIVAVAQRVATEIENRTRLHDLEQRVIERTRNLEQARLAALEASQAKSAFLSRVSHELRTPLNAIAGFSQLLDEEALVPGQKEMVGEIIQASSHLTRLIDEVLNISRIESGSLSLRRERLALPAAVERCRNMLAVLAARRDVRLSDDSAASDAWVTADPARLDEVLINLLSNAIKYNRVGGEVSIAVAPGAAGCWHLTVSDTGAGLTFDEQARLFQPFSRVGAAAHAVEGAGLGLMITRMLVDAMGGATGVTSSPGVGSTFWIALPRAG